MAVEGLNDRIRFRTEAADPRLQFREEVEEAGFEGVAMLLQVFDGIPDRRKARATQGDAVEDVIETFIAAVVAEPVVGNALLQTVGQFGR
jgi:hypothetical protein